MQVIIVYIVINKFAVFICMDYILFRFGFIVVSRDYKQFAIYSPALGVKGLEDRYLCIIIFKGSFIVSIERWDYFFKNIPWYVYFIFTYG